LVPVTCALALFALPLHAQRGGAANRRAPTVGQSIAFHNGSSVEIKYRSITWAQGRFMEQLKTEEGRAAANQDLAANPTGSLTASADGVLGGQPVKAGTYKLYFEVDGDQKFHLVLADEAGNQTKLKLDLKDSAHMTTRLTLSLMAGESDNDAKLYIAFGKMSCSVDLNANGASGQKPRDASAGKDGQKNDKGEQGKEIR